MEKIFQMYLSASQEVKLAIPFGTVLVLIFAGLLLYNRLMRSRYRKNDEEKLIRLRAESPTIIANREFRRELRIEAKNTEEHQQYCQIVMAGKEAPKELRKKIHENNMMLGLVS